MTETTQKLRIDIISDVVCPWCIVGYSQLKQALEATGTAHEIHWHPFELNPEMGPEGQNMGEHITEKYGSTREQSLESRKQLTQLGAGLGFEFNFADDMRMHNTFNAHQLIHWANTQGLGNALEQALFSAHFTHRRDLSDVNVLVEVAREAGLDASEAKAVLDDQRYAEDVRKIESFWIQQGIRGVPAIVFDQKHLVTGAQGTENYTSIVKQLTGADA